MDDTLVQNKLVHIFSHSHNGIERVHCRLEYHCDFIPSKAPEFLLGHLENVFSTIDYFTGRFVRRLNQSHDSIGDRAFSRAAFAQKPYAFSDISVKLDIPAGWEEILRVDKVRYTKIFDTQGSASLQ